MKKRYRVFFYIDTNVEGEEPEVKSKIAEDLILMVNDTTCFHDYNIVKEYGFDIAEVHI